MDLFLIALGISLVELFFPFMFSLLEKHHGKPVEYVHIALNLIFIVTSLYFINFVQMYPHGPSLIWLAFPAWPAFMIFYTFLYPKMLKDKKSRLLNPVISMIYLVGSLVGLFSIIRDWNIT